MQLALFENADTPMFGLIAIQENIATPMTEKAAMRLFSTPSYPIFLAEML